MCLFLGVNAWSQVRLEVDPVDVCYGESTKFYVDLNIQADDLDSLVLHTGDGNEIELLSLPDFSVFRHSLPPGEYKAHLIAYHSSGKRHLAQSDSFKVLEPPYFDINVFGTELVCQRKGKAKLGMPEISKNGRELVKWTWQIGNDLFEKRGGQFELNSIGKNQIKATAIDKLGCSYTVTKEYLVKPGPIAEFHTLDSIAECGKKVVSFANTSEVDSSLTKYWAWDWGIGRRHIDTFLGVDILAWDTIWNNFSRTYKKDGWISPKLIVKYENGCADSFVYKNAFQVHDYKLGIHWKHRPISDSNKVIPYLQNQEVTLRMKPRPNARSFQWSFGDSLSGRNNFNHDSWSPEHVFSSPGPYSISLFVDEGNCLPKDTTICHIRLVGPKASILKNDHSNTFTPAHPIANDTFLRFASDTISRLKSGQNGIHYWEVEKVSPYAYDSIPLYGNAPFTKTRRKVGACNDSVWQYDYQFQSTDYRPLYRDFKVIHSGNWKVGDPIPSGAIYSPSSGQHFAQNMHDTDLYAPHRSQNLVSFTNNSIKYRFQNGKQTIPLNFAPDNVPGEIPDTVLNPSYPWASDSLQYFWDFGDTKALPCTSTVAKPNVRCAYSSEIVPQHLYTSRGCHTAMLSVIDTTQGITNKDSIGIVMQKPSAAPDAVYQDLTFEKQLELDSVPKAGRRGLIMRGGTCISDWQLPDVSETLPSCGKKRYWVVYDVAAECDTVFYKKRRNGQTLDTFFLSCDWVPDTKIENDSFIYYYKTGGWKTTGLIVKAGNASDTFFYENNKFINEPHVLTDIYLLDSNAMNEKSTLRINARLGERRTTDSITLNTYLTWFDTHNVKKEMKHVWPSAQQEVTINMEVLVGKLYLLNLSASDETGCSTYYQEPILFGNVAQFHPEKQTFCVGEKITLYDTTGYYSETSFPTKVWNSVTKEVVKYSAGRSTNIGYNRQDFFHENHDAPLRKKWLQNPNYSLPKFKELIAWDFDGDSIFDAYGHRPTWKPEQPGEYHPRMYVRDSTGMWQRSFSYYQNDDLLIIKVNGTNVSVVPQNPADTLVFCGNKSIALNTIRTAFRTAGERVENETWSIKETGFTSSKSSVFVKGAGLYHVQYAMETTEECEYLVDMAKPLRVVQPEHAIEFNGLSKTCFPTSAELWLSGSIDSSSWYLNSNEILSTSETGKLSLAVPAHGLNTLYGLVYTSGINPITNKKESCTIHYPNTGSQTFNVSPPFKAELKASKDNKGSYTLEAVPLAADYYKWYKNGHLQQESTYHRSVADLSDDNIQICVSVWFEDCMDSVCRTFRRYPNSIQQPIHGLQVFPNPFSKHVTIAWQNQVDYQYQVYSVSGALIEQGKGDASFALNTASWQSGMYFLTLRSQESITTLKLIKE